jgi:hypothetical protein
VVVCLGQVVSLTFPAWALVWVVTLTAVTLAVVDPRWASAGAWLAGAFWIYAELIHQEGNDVPTRDWMLSHLLGVAALIFTSIAVMGRRRLART